MDGEETAELVFVVDVSSFTERGFLGKTGYEGREIAIEFDEGGEGVFIDPEMAKRIGVKKGSPVMVMVEGDAHTAAQSKVAGVGKALRISDAPVYYAIGKDGGGVVRVRKP